jgi:toxin ParE1/3/4
MKRYRLSFQARGDLDDIWDYSDDRWGSEQAADYLRQIRATIEMIAERPELGPLDHALRAHYRRRAVGSHVIFYRMGDVIEIVRVLHQNMDARAHLG